MDTSATQTRQDEIQAKYEQVQQVQRELRELLRQDAGMVVPDYELKDADGNTVRLSETFGDQDQLILIHNMGFKCSYCTMWADGLNGLVPYIQRRAAFALVSYDPPEKQKRGAEKRGWRFPMFSAEGTTLASDMGFGNPEDGLWPGASTLVKDPDGTIRRHNKTFFGPGDPFNGAWHLFDLLERNDTSIEPTEGISTQTV